MPFSVLTAIRRARHRHGASRALRVAIALVVLLPVAGVLLLRRAAARAQAAADAVVLTDTTSDPALWGRRYPRQYGEWRGGLEAQHSGMGGTARAADEDPRLARMWAGYRFGGESRLPRTHAHSLHAIDSMAAAPPAACLACHAAAYPELERRDDPTPGAYDGLRRRVVHAVSCVDCHDPSSMRLRVTRPAFIDALRRERAAAGVRNYDVNRDASDRELRTYVCAQCHAEYYLAGRQETLVLPWARGLRADSILSYYDSTAHVDWVHPASQAPLLRVQHATYELFAQGAHARAGVTCSDCHMPPRRSHGHDAADHRTVDPMTDVDHACRPCHDATAKSLQDRVAAIQTSTLELRTTALDALLSLIADIEAAGAVDSTRITLKAARDFQRRAQFLLDFVESERSLGFHAPQESARLLANSINFSRLGQTVVRGDGRAPVVDGAPARPRRRMEVQGGSGLRQAATIVDETGGGW